MADSVYELEQILQKWSFYDVESQLKNHVYTRAGETYAANASARASLQTVEALKQRKKQIRARFIQSLGGLPDAAGVPLHAQTVGVIQEKGLRIEKIRFESRPKVYVTANLYVPAIPGAGTEKKPAILFLCGHEKEGKHAPMHQTVCRILAAAGFIVLAQDPIGQGERCEYYEPEQDRNAFSSPTAEHNHTGLPCALLGQSLARYFVHDAMRGVDYLLSRSDVDPGKIGVTGNSGGGTQTAMLLMVDDRISAAAPGTFISGMTEILLSGKPQDSEQIWPDTPDIDHADMLLMMAPKPILVLAAAYDFFPFEGTQKTVEQAKRLYEIYGKGEHLQLFVDDTTHTYSVNMAKKAAVFFRFYFGQKSALLNVDYSPIEMDRLFCTQKGQVLAEYGDMQTVFKTNRTEMQKIKKGSQTKESVEWLVTKVYNQRKPSALSLKYVENGYIYDMRYTRMMWYTQKDMAATGVCFRQTDAGSTNRPVTVMLWEGGTRAAASHFEEIALQCREGRIAMVADLCADGCLSPQPVNTTPAKAPFGMLYTLNSHLVRLGDSIAAMRVYDVIRAVETASALAGSNGSVTVYARGRYSLYAVLASIVCPKIKLGLEPDLSFLNQIVTDKYYNESNLQSLIIPGLLRYFNPDDLQDCCNKNIQ